MHILKRTTEVRRLQRKMHQIIQSPPNNSNNNGRLTINPDILNETTRIITHFNILKEQLKMNSTNSQTNKIQRFTLQRA